MATEMKAGVAVAKVGRITVTAQMSGASANANPETETAWASASALFGIVGLNELDVLVRKHSCSTGLVELLMGTHPTYRPTLRVSEKSRRIADQLDCAERARIADAYDALAEAMHDDRRAFRSRG